MRINDRLALVALHNDVYDLAHDGFDDPLAAALVVGECHAQADEGLAPRLFLFARRAHFVRNGNRARASSRVDRSPAFTFKRVFQRRLRDSTFCSSWQWQQ